MVGQSHDVPTHSNVRNAIIAFLVPIPSILFFLYFLHSHDHDHDQSSTLWGWCFHHPFLLSNALFFLNVNLLFWVIGLLQHSHWMIDPYWTVIPVMLVHYYAAHPLMAEYNWWRSRVLMVMTWVWSLRLSHNYFRREKWEWGAREDWRFAEMRVVEGRSWWWKSFFNVYVSQQVFIMGVCLPMYFVHAVNKPFDAWDVAAVAVAMTGVVVAYFADTQLYDFVSENERLKETGKPAASLVLDRGLWYYSRHPNYFGEQLWWWGLGIFAWNLGYPWAFAGALVNSMCLAYVSVLVERRMLERKERTEPYRLYQCRTSVLIPWFKASSVDDSAKEKHA